ncbi:MAG: DUF721 domain-containing protein [Pseudobdellovibrionaceae bacterium]
MTKKREGKLLDSSTVLQRLFEDGKSPLSAQFLRWKLWGRWSDYVGSTIAAQTDPVGYLDGTLYVWVSNATWMQHLSFVRSQMKTNINTKLGKSFVKDIRLTLDRRQVPKADETDLQGTIAKLVSEGDD